MPTTAVLDTDIDTAGTVKGNGTGVVISRLPAEVSPLDGIQDTVASRARAASSGNGPLSLEGRVSAIGQRTGVGLVDEHVASVNIPVDVAGLLGNELEQVSTTVPATEGGEAPVCGEGSDDGVVGVEGVVGGSLQVLGDGAADEEAVHAVGDGVVAGLVEGDEHQGVLGEVLVLQERGDEVRKEVASNLDVAVMGVIGHVGGNEHVLGQTLPLQIFVEAGEVLDLARALIGVCDGVEENEGVVLAHVLVRSRLGPAVALVSGVGHVLHVLAPGDTPGVEEIGNGGDIGGDLVPVVVVHAEVVTGGGSTVVGLRGVSSGKVVGQQNALLCELGKVRIVGSSLEVL